MTIEAYLDHFDPVSEFPTPHFEGDGCGETACAVLEHCKDGAPITGDAIYSIRADMAAHGYDVAGGTTMGELVSYFRAHRGLDIVYACDYGSPYATIHQTLLAHAGRDGVVLQVNAAFNLTGNEGGVHSHYVAIGGIHPTLGYLVGNGDDIRALNPHHGQEIPPRWMPWSVIESADPKAVAIVRGLPHHIVSGSGPDATDTSGGTPSATAGVPAGWHDDGSTLTASNGVPVIHGFRALVLATPGGWDAANVPTGPEQGDPQSSYQPFMGGVAAWVSGADPQYIACPALAHAVKPAAEQPGGGPGGSGEPSRDPAELVTVVAGAVFSI